MAAVRFGVLGALEVTSGGVQLRIGGTQRVRLLAVLLLEAEHVVPLARLIDALWEEPPPTAKTQVHKIVLRLRQTLGSHVLVTDPAGYRLCLDDHMELDTRVFAEQVQLADRAVEQGHLPAAVAAARAGLDLWRGPALAGVSGAVIRAAAQRLDEQRLAVLERCLGWELELGQHARAAAELAELVAQYPLRERFRGLLMLALSCTGRQADALAAYEHGRQNLAEELGLDPGPELRAVHQRILAGHDGPSAGGSAVGRVIPRMLPCDVPDFTGRTEQLRRIVDMGEHARTVVVSATDGMAGVGKTALVVHAAHRLAPHYPDGQLFVDLHGHSEGIEPVDPADALGGFLRALGVPWDGLPRHIDALAALFRSSVAGRRMVIVLDNAIDERQVIPLLPGAPGCRVLITSRRRLVGLEHAQTLTLDPMSPADARAMLGVVTNTSETVHTVLIDEVAELCGRLPLAIRVAAARLRTRRNWTLEHLAEQLREQRRRIPSLRAGALSVGAAFRLSYTHLGDQQQRLFRLLGLHPGADFDTYAAAALAGLPPDRVEPLLDDLLDAHVLESHQPDRYQLHDFLRVLAGQVAVEESEADRHRALARLRDYYAYATFVAVNRLYAHNTGRHPDIGRPAAEVPRLDTGTRAAAWLDTELTNVLATARSEETEHTSCLSALLSNHLQTCFRYTEAEILHDRALLGARRVGDRTGELRAMVCLGSTYLLQGRLERATGFLSSALTLARRLGDRRSEVDALAELAQTDYARGRLAIAETKLAEAARLAHTVSDRVGEGAALVRLAAVRYDEGRYPQAAVDWERALILFRQLGNRFGERKALLALGRINQVLGNRKLADDYLATGLALPTPFGSHLSRSEIFETLALGTVRFRQNRWDDARDCFHRALETAEAVAYRNGQLESALHLGVFLQDTDAPARSLPYLQQALELAQALGQSLDEARVHHATAQAHIALGNTKLARHHWELALAVLVDLDITRTDAIDITVIRARLAELGRK